MKLVNQGMILGEQVYTGFQRATGTTEWISAEQVDFDGDVAVLKKVGSQLNTVRLDEDRVEKKGDSFVLKEAPNVRIDARAYKMAKSRANVINPDDVVNEYGADSLRLFEMFM